MATDKTYVVEKYILYLTVFTGFFGVAFFAVDLGPFTLFPYRGLLCLLWIVFLARILITGGKLKLFHIKVRLYLEFLAVWVAYAVLSLGWAASKSLAIRDVILLFMGTSIIFFSIYHLRSLRDLQNLYWLWLFALGVQMVIGTWEVTTGLHLPMAKYFGEIQLGFKFRPTGTLGGPNSFASFLCFGGFFILAFLRHMNKGVFRKILVGGMLALILYLIIMTRSRGNYLAVMLAMTFSFVFMLKFREKFITTVLIGLILFLLVWIFPQQTDKVWLTAKTQFSALFAPIELGQGSIGIRLALAKNSLASVTRSFGFGAGVGNVGTPHNWWLELLASYGIWIFAGYTLFYSALMLNLYKVYKKLTDGTERMMCEALLLSLIAFFFVAFSPSSIKAFKPQWFLFAFALAFLNYYRLSRGGYS